MALENNEVLENLIQQRKDLTEQLDSTRITLIKVEGAIDVLQQIEKSKEEPSDSVTPEVVKTDE